MYKRWLAVQLVARNNNQQKFQNFKTKYLKRTLNSLNHKSIIMMLQSIFRQSKYEERELNFNIFHQMLHSGWLRCRNLVIISDWLLYYCYFAEESLLGDQNRCGGVGACPTRLEQTHSVCSKLRLLLDIMYVSWIFLKIILFIVENDSWKNVQQF